MGERLGEDLRLLYVALTRARHAWLAGLADFEKPARAETSGIGHLQRHRHLLCRWSALLVGSPALFG